MKKFRLLLIAGILTSISGSTLPGGASLHPFFEESDLYDDPRVMRLLENEAVLFERVGIGHDKACDPQKAAKPDCWNLWTFRIGGATFLDAQQDENGYVIAPHLVFRVDSDEDEPDLLEIDEKGLTAQMEAKALSLSHVKLDGGILLTAKTSELRNFLQAHASDPAIFWRPKD